jgi:para-nitrobenzyl esterase
MGTPVVSTRGGLVGGTESNGVQVFRGIPYASPPVGRLRFAAPVAHDSWSGVRDATRFGPAPPQSMRATDTDEWLTVNVWTPSATATGLPVLVWLYGGKFTTGSSDQPEYEVPASRPGVWSWSASTTASGSRATC